MKIQIGQILLERYRVDSFVASGGMGSVYCVWDLKRNAALAMKVLRSELAEDPSIFKKFEREANALKKLTHPNIVPFYGIYHIKDEYAFLLEHFIGGVSLADVLKQNKGQPLPLKDVLTYLKAICSALGYAHVNGVIHCDVKPGNILIDQGGGVYLTDFGVARHSDSDATTLGMAGTPAYMAPEQILDKPVTPSTDVYALGVMLFEMVTGQRPFRGGSTESSKSGVTIHERVRYEHLHLSPPDPHAINSSVSSKLSNVILKALNKEQFQRYSSTDALFVAVCDAVGILPSDVADRVPLHLSVSSYIPPPTAMSESLPPQNSKPNKSSLISKSRFLIVGGVFISLLLFCALAFAGIRFGLGAVTAVGSTSTLEVLATDIEQSTPDSTTTQVVQLNTVTAPTVNGSFTEEFDVLPTNWSPFIVNGYANSWLPSIKNKSLFFNLTSKDLGAYFSYDPFSYKDVKITLVAENRGDYESAISVICRRGEEGWYEFNVTSLGFYHVFYKNIDVNGKIKASPIANGASAKFHPGKDVNEYTVTCQKRTLSLMVNGFETVSVDDNQFALKEGAVGIGVTSFGEVPAVMYIDQVKVEQLGAIDQQEETQQSDLDATPSADGSFVEGFSTLPTSWSSFVVNGDANSWTPAIKNNSLFFNLTSSDLGAYFLYDPFSYKDTKITVVTENRGDYESATSVICRYGEEGWYEFNIKNSGLFRILYKSRDVNGKIKEAPIGNGGSTKAHPGKDVNEYTIICQRKTLSLIVNGFEAISVDDNKFALKEGLIGIGVTSFDKVPAIVYINQVKVSQP